MHASAVGKYEGPPCKACTDRQFVGVCTHRPISQAYRDKISRRMKEVWASRAMQKALKKSAAGLKDLEPGLRATFGPFKGHLSSGK